MGSSLTANQDLSALLVILPFPSDWLGLTFMNWNIYIGFYSNLDIIINNNNNNTIFRQVCVFSWLAAINQGPV